MHERSHGPGRWRAPLLPAPTKNTRHSRRQALPLGDQLVSCALNTYLKVLSAVAFISNVAVIVSVPATALTERVPHTVSALRTNTRRDPVSADRMGES
jgi:hypothetical protein